MAWLYTDAVQKASCPKCGQVAGAYCRTPKGRKAREPHMERVVALRALPSFSISDYTCKTESLDEVVQRLTRGEC